ncbi:MAG TPA: hypothetical protein DSN98_01915 [Thermoplasmata archaeon]|nr:MAG TPA: hypothetical protein DSN98_01915 [Thermoplasmata archaeon]
MKLIMDQISEKDRISKMVIAIERVARGDYSTQIVISNKNDDFDSLAIGINMMIEDLGESFKENKKNQELLQEKINILEGNDLATLNIMEDLYETTDKMKKLSEIKSAFLNMTSHELRTPIVAIKGYIQMILRGTLGPINDEQKNALDIAQRNSDRLARLIQDILDVSRLESGTMKFVVEKTNIEKMIKEVYDAMQITAGLKGIKIDTEVEKAIPELGIDNNRITQVIINILTNAVKFSPNGSVINVRVKKQDQDILFEIQDFGRGISTEHHQKIFQTFYQVDSSTDVKFGGAGLGLAICYGIVVAHGGRIWVESEGIPGKGSTFKFVLPVESITGIEKRFKGVDLFGLGTGTNTAENPLLGEKPGEMNELEKQVIIPQDSFKAVDLSCSSCKILDETQNKCIENAQFLSTTAIELANFPIGGDIYQYIGEKIQQMVSNAFVTIAYFDENSSNFIINKVLGYGKYMEKFLQILGKDPAGTNFVLNDEGIRQQLIQGKFIHLSVDDFNRFVLPQFPKAISLIIDKLMNLNELYTIALVKDGKIFGNIFVAAKNDCKIQNLEVIETFINQAAIAIQRNNAIKEIKDLNKYFEFQNIQLQKLNDIKTTFLKNTSHELRTPITAIKGYTQMLLKQSFGGTNAEQMKGLEVILRNTNRLDHTIQNILDISNVQTGTLIITPCNVNPKTLVEETTKTLQAYDYEKEMVINVDVEKELPDLIVDCDKIKQVIQNLVGNAIKFSPDGSVINIRARKENDDILFEVQDFGRGISKDKQEMIFEPFYQVDSGDDRLLGGVGLSLALCKGIIKLHGGKIWVESSEGKGSIFRFVLPIKSNDVTVNKIKELAETSV